MQHLHKKLILLTVAMWPVLWAGPLAIRRSQLTTGHWNCTSQHLPQAKPGSAPWLHASHRISESMKGFSPGHSSKGSDDAHCSCAGPLKEKHLSAQRVRPWCVSYQPSEKPSKQPHGGLVCGCNISLTYVRRVEADKELVIKVGVWLVIVSSPNLGDLQLLDCTTIVGVIHVAAIRYIIAFTEKTG
jgi:hypothetical protein